MGSIALDPINLISPRFHSTSYSCPPKDSIVGDSSAILNNINGSAIAANADGFSQPHSEVQMLGTRRKGEPVSTIARKGPCIASTVKFIARSPSGSRSILILSTSAVFKISGKAIWGGNTAALTSNDLAIFVITLCSGDRGNSGMRFVLIIVSGNNAKVKTRATQNCIHYNNA
jgi:hypothetical protein